MTDLDIAQMMNRQSLQGGNNDSPWWLLFARDVERAAATAERERIAALLDSDWSNDGGVERYHRAWIATKLRLEA